MEVTRTDDDDNLSQMKCVILLPSQVVCKNRLKDSCEGITRNQGKVED
jgi:hypothetical protein